MFEISGELDRQPSGQGALRISVGSFKAPHARVLTWQAATFAGALCDVDFSTGELFSESDVRDAARYWWGPDRARNALQQYLFVSVLAKEDTQVGQLILAESATKVAGLVLAWSMAVESEDKELAEVYAQVANNVVFGVNRILSSESASANMVLRLIQAGEDNTKVANESGNFLPFVLASRLVRPGIRSSRGPDVRGLFCRLRAALKAQGEPTTHDAVFEKLKDIQWAGEESAAAGLHISIRVGRVRFVWM